MNYVPAYKRPDFVQCREHGPEWVPMESEGGCLRFRNTITGQTVSCPAIWYNQTVEADCSYLTYCIDRTRERRRYWESSPDKWAAYQIADCDKSIADLQDLISRSRAAGRPLRNNR